MLKEQQLSHFNTFGFVIFRQLFNPDELKTINAEIELRLSSTKRYTSSDDGPTYMSWPNLGPETPCLAGLPEDPAHMRHSGATLRRGCDWTLLQCRQLCERYALASRCHRLPITRSQICLLSTTFTCG